MNVSAREAAEKRVQKEKHVNTTLISRVRGNTQDINIRNRMSDLEVSKYTILA